MTSDKLFLTNDQFQAIVELCPEPIVIYCDNIIEYVNPAGVTMIGATNKSEIVGKHIIEFMLPEDIVRTYLHNEVAIREKSPSDFIEYNSVRLDGKVITVEARSIAITYGTRTAIQLLCRDITHRRKIEEALRESEQRLYSMLQQSPDAIVVHYNGILNYVNNATLKLFRAASHEQMIGKSIYDFIHIDSHLSALHRLDLLKTTTKRLESTIHTMIGLD
jgi:PAS domain S-box-containing protein